MAKGIVTFTRHDGLGIIESQGACYVFHKSEYAGDFFKDFAETSMDNPTEVEFELREEWDEQTFVRNVKHR